MGQLFVLFIYYKAAAPMKYEIQSAYLGKGSTMLPLFSLNLTGYFRILSLLDLVSEPQKIALQSAFTLSFLQLK